MVVREEKLERCVFGPRKRHFLTIRFALSDLRRLPLFLGSVAVVLVVMNIFPL